MQKISVNTRDELTIINTEDIIYIKANGNYTEIFYNNGLKMLLSLGIGKVEQMIAHATQATEQSIFCRLGRSLIINQRALHYINIPKQQLVLINHNAERFVLEVPRQILKAYKELLNSQRISQ